MKGHEELLTPSSEIHSTLQIQLNNVSCLFLPPHPTPLFKDVEGVAICVHWFIDKTTTLTIGERNNIKIYKLPCKKGILKVNN
jgi:hypothetical protein